LSILISHWKLTCTGCKLWQEMFILEDHLVVPIFQHIMILRRHLNFKTSGEKAFEGLSGFLFNIEDSL